MTPRSRFRIFLAFLLIFSCSIFIPTLNYEHYIRKFLNIDQLETIHRQLEIFDSNSAPHKIDRHPKVVISPSPNTGQDMRGWKIISEKITNIISRDNNEPHANNDGKTNTSFTGLVGRLDVYIWWESCYSSVNAFKASLGFPYAPQDVLYTRSLFISRGRKYYAERIFGYILPINRGFYRFSFTTLTPIEVWLSVDSDPQNSKLILSTLPTQSTIQSKSIYLHKRPYYLEILHLSTTEEDTFIIQWLPPGASEYIPIANTHFQTVPINTHPKFPSTFPMHIPIYDKTHVGIEATNLHRVPLQVYNQSFPECYKLNSFAEPHTLLQYNGIYELENIEVYPEDGSQLYNVMQHYDQVLSIAGNEKLPLDTTENVVSTFLTQTASDLLAVNLTFSRVNRIESRSSNGIATRYLIDIMLENIYTLQPYRLMDVFFIEGRYSSRLCTIPDYVITHRSTFIYFIIVVKNLGQPLMAFVQEMEKLWYKTEDENFGLIVVDFASTDLNVSDLLVDSHIRHYKYISISGPFIKVQGQNAALQSIQDDDVIAFLCDLHLHIPHNILNEIRTHTVRSISAYAPIVFRLQCGHSLVNPLGFWEVWGTGLFAMFRSDWRILGGMDTDKYYQSWGGEDSDLLDRTLALGYEVERKALPGLAHFYHTHFGMWNV